MSIARKVLPNPAPVGKAHRSPLQGKPPVTYDFYVSATGSSSNPGSYTQPWDLATALSGGNGLISPGHRIAVRGGLYTKSSGQWTCTIGGDRDRPVVFQAYKNERVRIETTTAGNTDAFVINANYTWWWGLEFYRNVSERSTGRGSSVWVHTTTDGTKLIHCVLRDGENGLFSDYTNGNVELYGCYAYNNGIDTDPRGHGFYIRHSGAGRFVAEGCVLFNQLGHGVQVFGTSGVDDIDVVGTISFNSGVLGTSPGSAGWSTYVIGGSGNTAPVRRNKLQTSVGYIPNTYGRRGIYLGSSAVTNEDLLVSDIYVVSPGFSTQGVLELQAFQTSGPTLSFLNNFISTHGNATRILDQNQSGTLPFVWDNNDWRRDPTATAWRHGGADKTFATWQANSGLGTNDVASSTDPTATKIFVIPANKYEDGRGHVCFFNWANLTEVPVGLLPILQIGDEYEVYNVQDLFGTPVLTGTYDGSFVEFPTTGVTPPAPIGTCPSTAPTTAPFFDCFLVKKVVAESVPETTVAFRTPADLLPSDAYYIAGVLTAPSSGLSSGSPTINSLVAVDFVVPVRMRVDRIGFSVIGAGGAGSVARCGIYTNTAGTNYPGTLVVDGGEFVTTSTGFKVATIDTILEPGLYWFVYLAGTAAPTVKCASTNDGSALFFGWSSNLTNRQHGWVVTQTYGALPTSFPAGGVVNSGVSKAAVGVRPASIVA